MATSEIDRTSFQICERCDGRGFVRKGTFAERTFPKCETCKGLGQFYLLEPKS